MTAACLPIDYVEVRVRPSAVPDDWKYHRFAPGQPILIPGVEVGVQYVVETRCVPKLGGIPSDWSAATHTVQAARLYLPQVTGAAATPLADGVHLMWTRPAGLAADVRTEIYRAPDAGGMPGTFTLLFIAPGTAYNDAVTNGALYWYTMRFVDYGGSSGSYSTPVYARAKTVEDGATNGAVLGTNLMLPGGGGVVSNLDQFPDGTNYARLRANQLQRGVLIGKIQGANLCPNPGFELNDADFPAGAVLTASTGICDGWYRSVSTGGWAVSRETSGFAPHSGGANLLISLQPGQSLGPGTYGCVVQSDRINVIGGDDYIYGGFRRADAHASLPGTVSALRRIGLFWYRADGSACTPPESYADATGAAGIAYEADYLSYRITAPSDAAYARFQCAAFIIVASGTFNTGSSLYCDARFDDMRLTAAVSIDKHVVDGPVYSRTGTPYLQAGRPRSVTSGKNMLVNPTFELASVGIGTGGGGVTTMQAGVIVLDGWETTSGDGTNIGAFPQDAVQFAYDTVAFAGSRAVQLRVPAGQGITVNSNSYHALALQSDRVYPRPNEAFLLTGQRWVDSAYLTSVAGLEFIARVGICWFTSTGTLLSSGGFQFADLSAGTGSAYAGFTMTGSVPAAAAFGRVYIGLFVRNTTGATITPGNFYAVFRVDDLSFTQPVSLDAEVLDGGTFGKTRVDILTDNRPDFAKPIPNRTADYIAETGGRRWAAESGATVGATAGVNLRRNSGVTLDDADVITSMGTANDVANVNGTAAAIVRSNAFAGWALTDPTTGVRVGGGRNLPPVRTAGAGSQWNGANLTASWDSASPANVTITAAAGTLQQGSFGASFGASSVALGAIPRGSPQTFRLYYEGSTILLGGTFSLQATSNPVTLVSSDLRIHVGTITFTVPVSGGSGSGGTPTRGGGGVIP
ncbi:hypothetical protein [Nevskia sp.]|uniref:hypothetical protein n=1 Tax=Nevskia sp. TaxID=1929292 RepID=UPI0025E32FBD|nr:hypothetical protein [Nevskia sp.]